MSGALTSSATYLRRRAAAEYLREQRGIPCGEKTLAKLACIGGGPVYRRFGRIPLYLFADLDAYASHHPCKPKQAYSEVEKLGGSAADRTALCPSK